MSVRLYCWGGRSSGFGPLHMAKCFSKFLGETNLQYQTSKYIILKNLTFSARTDPGFPGVGGGLQRGGMGRQPIIRKKINQFGAGRSAFNI